MEGIFRVKRVKPKMASGVRLKKDQKIVVTIKRLGINGEGIGYYKRKIVFIPKALPGEVVLASVTEAKEKYAKARLLKIKQESQLEFNQSINMMLVGSNLNI